MELLTNSERKSYAQKVRNFSAIKTDKIFVDDRSSNSGPEDDLIILLLHETHKQGRIPGFCTIFIYTRVFYGKIIKNS